MNSKPSSFYSIRKLTPDWPHGVSTTRVRFIRLPSFEPCSVWILQRGNNLAQVRRIEWDHLTDAQLRDAVPGAPPATFGADARLSVAAADELLSELATIHLPPISPGVHARSRWHLIRYCLRRLMAVGHAFLVVRGTRRVAEIVHPL